MCASHEVWPILAALITSGCMAASTAPEGWRRSRADAERLALGSWTRVESRQSADATRENPLQDDRAQPAGPALVTDGELIAIDGESVVLAKGGDVAIVPRGCVGTMTIAAFEPGLAGTIVPGVVGTVSTISHGFLLVLSAPIWLVTTLGSTWAQSAAGTLENPQDAAPWARFPQGLPPGFLEQARHVTRYGNDCLPGSASAPVPGGGQR